MARGPWSPEFVPHRLTGPVVEILLEALAAVNALYLAEHPSTPSVYAFAASGDIAYVPDPLGIRERWLAIPWIIERKGADCKSLVAWRVAELRRAGEAARGKYLQQGAVFHVFVERGDGSYEDPSTLLGMPYPKELVWGGT